jgi:iron complex transport system ATP-binding protein
MTSILEVRRLWLEGRLKPADLDIGLGELIALIGPNGGGKTSLLRAIAGIESSGGEVRVDGEDLQDVGPARRPYFATFLPASRDLVWPISAHDVIALGLPRPNESRVAELIESLELGDLAARRADQLSTGERARVLLARALAPRPKLLLLDEPLSNLDPYWTLRLLEILRETTSAGAAALVAVHDIDRIAAFDRGLLMSNGRIQADIGPEEMLASEALSEAFRIERTYSGWKVRRSADPRSSQ